MATLTKRAPANKTLNQILDGLFRIPEVSLLAKDGSRRHFRVSHRIGKDRVSESNPGYFTVDTLIDKMELDDEIVEKARIYEKLGKEALRKEFGRLHREARNTVRNAVRGYKSGPLTGFYTQQGIAPILTFMPGVDPKHPKKRGCYIVGFYDTASLMPVLGDIDDITLALEIRNAYLKGAVDEYRENQGIAKKAIGLPGINRDLQNRLQHVVAGEVDRQYLIQQIEKS